MSKAYYHLPGLFEFYDLYQAFLPLYKEHRDWFYDWCEIGSIYGAPADCLWGGGRVGFGEEKPKRVIALMQEYGISPRLTFSNSLLREEHLEDPECNELCELFASSGLSTGIILCSDILMDYLKERYPDFYFVSSTTKVITDMKEALEEIARPEFSYVVPDFRLNRWLLEEHALLALAPGGVNCKPKGPSPREKNCKPKGPSPRAKVEFLCNECCDFGCADRKACYENVSRKSLGEDCADHVCRSMTSKKGYQFSKAMKNPAFIGINDILETYLPLGYQNFKIEGRSLGSAMILEFLLYYMTKPECQLLVREAIYLDSSLDLF